MKQNDYLQQVKEEIQGKLSIIAYKDEYQRGYEDCANHIIEYIDSLICNTNATSTDFFTELAESLRVLWPTGEKDGKYPWRESVANLKSRLELLWKVRELKDYSLDECLTAARRYLAQFEDNVKYMKTLKYFILRQNEKVVAKDGRIHYINQSTFADMLESNSSISDEWEEAFNSTSTMDGGEII